MVLTQISRSRFKQSKISLLNSHIYVLGSVLCFGDFLVFLGINIFSQWIGKIDGNRKFVRLLYCKLTVKQYKQENSSKSSKSEIEILPKVR